MPYAPSFRLQTKLYMSTAAPMLELFSGSSESQRFYSDHQRNRASFLPAIPAQPRGSLIGSLHLRPTVSEDLQLTDQETVTSPIFTGEEEVFAFQRCVSRLSEMGGIKWLAFQEVADR